MATTYRIAAVGDWESVMGFRAIGLDTYPVASVEEAKDKIRELAKNMEELLDRYKDELRPAIILIPGREGSLGIGKENLQRAIERAVGADIL